MAGVSASTKAQSVSAVLAQAKSILQERTFKIIGEVSELNDKPGYKAVYFTIKDDKSSLPCLIWKSRYQSCGVSLQIGSKVEITGKFSIFTAKGRMNFDVSSITFAGEGDLRLKVAQLAQRLKAEGLMEPSQKLKIPSMPLRIGVVTSPRGAAVFDVLRTLRRRFPLAEIVFAGVPVEGKNAPRDLCRALNAVYEAGVEVILLVRGGGSFEDLMPFNDEELARTISSLPVPVVTGIGHEPDTSIADMVADLRASTPTAAAESVTYKADELYAVLDQLKTRMSQNILHRIARSNAFLDALESRPALSNPISFLESDFQLLDYLHARLDYFLKNATQAQAAELNHLEFQFRNSFTRFFTGRTDELARISERFYKAEQVFLSKKDSEYRLGAQAFQTSCKMFLNKGKSEVALIASRLDDLSPLKTLSRGWSIASDEKGEIIKSVSQVSPGDSISVQVRDGEIFCQVEEGQEKSLFDVIEWEN